MLCLWVPYQFCIFDIYSCHLPQYKYRIVHFLTGINTMALNHVLTSTRASVLSLQSGLCFSLLFFGT